MHCVNYLLGGGAAISLLSRYKKENPEPGKISLRCSGNRFDALINTLIFRAEYSTKIENMIIDTALNDSYDMIWIDECDHGSTVKKIKQLRPDMPVYVFWHTVPDTRITPEYVSKNIFSLKGPLNIMKAINLRNQHRLSAEYADMNVLLNERDMTTFTELYGSRPTLMLPACFIDTAHIAPEEKKPGEFNILFVGGGGHLPNVHGIKWFAEKVMPGLDERARLFIVGERMTDHKDAPEFRDPRISITGRVESLDPYYNMADLVICPVFLGAGMMTKVAEAMMYGKNILATSHSLNGYHEIEESCRCDTPEEYITRINAMIENGTERFNPEMRKIFEEKYSVNAMANTLRESLMQRGII